MPFNTKTDLDNGGVVALWSLTETENELKKMLEKAGIQDSNDELKVIKVARKRKQWMAARLLLKHLIPTFKEITYDQFGAPYIVDHEMNVSLSHSSGHIATILHKTHEVGIDVQVEDRKLKRIATKFLNADEMKRYKKKKESLNYLHLLWSAKEAVFKVHRHHMAFKKIRTADFKLTEKGSMSIEADRFDGQHEHEVHFRWMTGLYMAYTCYDTN